MIDYELAKQLEDAGFPNIKLCEREDEHEMAACLDCYYEHYPTLSELIEAVKGDKPNSFYLEFNDEWSVYEEPNPEGKWRCRYYARTPVGFYEVFANTPEEAVARLYLALKGK